MAIRKFNIGDKVVVNTRCPRELLSKLRKNRGRTIMGRYYDPERQCSYYHLGYNYQGASSDIEAYSFRSYMLNSTVKGRRVGRPRQKRTYQRSN